MAKFLYRYLPAPLVPWVLGFLYTMMLILVVTLWARNIDPAGPYLNVQNSLTEPFDNVV